MKIKIKKDILLSHLKIINQLHVNTYTSPIIQGLLIEVTKDQINLVSTNGFVSISSKILSNFTFIKEGTLLIKAKLFLNIIQKLNNEEILIEKIDNSILKIVTNDFDSNINIMDYKQFPIINFDYKNWKEICLKSNIFIDIKEKLIQSVSQNKEKPSILNGICFKSEDGLLEIFASDSYKLSYLKYKYNTLSFKIVLDYSLIMLIVDNLNIDNVFLYINGNNIFVKIKETIFSAKIMEEEYPNINSIINSPIYNELSINKKDLINALDRGIILAMIEKKPICKIEFEESISKIYFKSIELGNSIEKIKVENFKGNPITIYVNAYFLLSLLKVFNSEKILIGTSTENKPIILWTEKEENFLQLVLPVRNN